MVLSVVSFTTLSLTHCLVIPQKFADFIPIRGHKNSAYSVLVKLWGVGFWVDGTITSLWCLSLYLYLTRWWLGLRALWRDVDAERNLCCERALSLLRTEDCTLLLHTSTSFLAGGKMGCCCCSERLFHLSSSLDVEWMPTLPGNREKIHANLNLQYNQIQMTLTIRGHTHRTYSCILS